jgi:hypothetical protein
LVGWASLGWSSDTPAMAESTLVRSEVSADMLMEMDWVDWGGIEGDLVGD